MRVLYSLVFGFLLLSNMACLQTRGQYREDSREEADDSQSDTLKHSSAQAVEPPGQYALDEIKLEITRIEGRLQDIERAEKDQQSAQQSAQQAAPSKDEFKKLQDHVSQLEANQAELVENLKKAQEQVVVAADPNKVFDRAKADYEDQQLEKATQEFSAYLGSPHPKKAEQATFLRAESYYKLKQYKKAIIDYSKFPEKYKSSPHMPEALYKIGLSFESLGMKEDAKGFYQELIEKFPKTPQAKKAKLKAHSGR